MAKKLEEGSFTGTIDVELTPVVADEYVSGEEPDYYEVRWGDIYLIDITPDELGSVDNIETVEDEGTMPVQKLMNRATMADVGLVKDEWDITIREDPRLQCVEAIEFHNSIQIDVLRDADVIEL